MLLTVCLQMVTTLLWDHCVMYVKVKSLCCTPATEVMYIMYISIFKKLVSKSNSGKSGITPNQAFLIISEKQLVSSRNKERSDPAQVCVLFLDSLQNNKWC